MREISFVDFLGGPKADCLFVHWSAISYVGLRPAPAIQLLEAPSRVSD